MNQTSNKAVFLDRDGVINGDSLEYVKNVEDFHLFPASAKAIKVLNDRGYKVFVVTNQGGIAKGLMTHADLAAIHSEMETRLAKEGARIDKIYFCPHHEQGTVAEFAIACDCRKPNTGMIDQAVREFGIDLSKSFMVGDKTGDVLAGQNAGMKTVLVRTGYAGTDGYFTVTPDFVADDLWSAVSTYIS